MNQWQQISIHAPLAGRDKTSREHDFIAKNFNPRAPRGARPHIRIDKPLVRTFQSTRPSRGATTKAMTKAPPEPFQSTRPSRGATPCAATLRTGQSYFNPRAPRGARPPFERCVYPALKISIHAPLAGRDLCWACMTARRKAFQSTRPSRGATGQQYWRAWQASFQSTRPSRGATTPFERCVYPALKISIHAPLAGRDPTAARRWTVRNISIHAPLAGRDQDHCPYYAADKEISIHAPLAGRDLRH